MERTIKENRHIIQCCAECILSYGRQCLALRGDCEVSGANGNPGNFLALMKLLAKHDPAINAHLESPKLRNASYVSPHIQNELINIIGKNIIQKHLVNEVVSAKHFSIMVDGITSFNKEVMPLCVRFVDSNRDIREEFLQYSILTRVTGKATATCVLDSLNQLGLDVKNVRGQGYDGASNMSSERIGLQAMIKQHSPLAVYTHCAGHCLNLAISHSCSIPIIRNAVNKIKNVCMFFLNSPKRNQLLIEIVSANLVESSKRAPLLDCVELGGLQGTLHTNTSTIVLSFLSWHLKSLALDCTGKVLARTLLWLFGTLSHELKLRPCCIA